MRTNGQHERAGDPLQAAVQECYQCGKCSAGCPMADTMDRLPNQLLRLVQLGRADQAAASEAIWLCLSCHACSSRCPKSVDCAGVMDALRQRSLVRGAVAPAQQRTPLFHRVFLDNIRRYGRLNEIELIGMFKAAAFRRDLDPALLLKDALLAPRLLRRGKLQLRGERVRDRGVVRRIFDRCLAGEKG